jgi:sugar/nucleoside kinase (ribokinase family)/fructoselysine-6-P-deglycase FrlB-like protein
MTDVQVVVIGNVTIDDVVHAFGETTMASPGGNTIHAAAAAKVWDVRVGLAARLGTDFPAEALARLNTAGFDTAGLRPVDGPTVRNWVIYEHDGRRTWVYRTPPERRVEMAPSPGDIPDGWLPGAGDPPIVHVAAMPFDAAVAIVEHVRTRAGEAVITLDTHEDWDPRCNEILELARRVDVFLPSHEELAAMLGYDDPERGATALLAQGVPAVVVKRGALGTLVAVGDRPVVSVAPPQVAVVDETGAGDSFCGGFVAGLALGDSHVVAAQRGAATAGAAIGASGSLRLLRRAPNARSLFDRYQQDLPPRLASPTQDGDSDDSDVMEREISTIPAVISDRLALASQAAATVERLRETGIRRLVLVGCGDSCFAGQAAVLALNRHSGLAVRWEHALDFARYGVRYEPPGTAVVCISFSGSTGRTIEAAVQARAFGHLVVALTGKSDGALAQASDLILSAEIPTFGFSPGTSTYTAMLVTLLTLAKELAPEPSAGLERYAAELQRLPELAERTLGLCDGPSAVVAEKLVGARMTTFLGGGPNEATSKFGAAKLFEGAQQIALSTNVEEWAHEQYFITRLGEPVVVVAPSGSSLDRATEILSELHYIEAMPVWVSDQAPIGAAAHLPLPAGVSEELTPVLAAIPMSQIGLHLMRLNGKRSYNFPDEEAAREHYDTIHRATIGEPA